MTDTGRTPLMAIFVSLLAVVFPMVSGAPRVTTATANAALAPKPPPHDDKPNKEENDAKATTASSTTTTTTATTTATAKTTATTTTTTTTTAESCDQRCCAAKRNAVFVTDASCEGAFVGFLAESERVASPSASSGCVALSDGHPRRLVATLPDPLETGMRASFDEGVEALFKGLEALDFLSNRFWSPWHAAELAEKGGTSAVARCAQRVPAVFTFQRCNAGRRCEQAELFIVGESATSGLAHEAARIALSLASAAEPRVSVIGPTFSGTAVSLREVMDGIANDEKGNRPKFRVTTGTASLKEVKTLLADGERIEFSARVLSSEAIRQGFFRYLVRALPLAVTVDENVEGNYRWLEHVALFTETGTSFGAHVQDRDEPEEKPRGSPRYNAGIVVHFPLHVGMIRESLSDQEGSSRPESPTIGGITLHQVELHPGRDSADRRDTPSPLSNQTSTAEDLVLAEQTKVLEEEDVRVVGIFASDPVDALFLVRRLRERLPSAHLFVFEHDALFGHPEHASELRGVMLVSTYPSTARADRWMFPYKESDRRLLSSPAATGIYNATLFGSGFMPNPLEPPIENLSLAYAPPFESPLPGAKMRPSIWISAIGAGGVMPVAVVAADDDGYAEPLRRTMPRTAGRRRVVDLDEDNVFAGNAWQLWEGALNLGLLSFALGVYLAVAGKELPVAMHWFRIFRKPRQWDPSLDNRWKLGASLVILGYSAFTVCLSCLAIPVLETPLWRDRVAISPHANWLSVSQVAFQAVISCLGAWSLSLVLSSRRWRVACFLVWLLPIAAALFAQWRFFIDAKNPFWGDLPLAYLRWTSLGSQLSPVVAIMTVFTMLIVGASQYLAETQAGGKHPADVVVHVFGFEDLEVPRDNPRALVARKLSRIQRVAIDCISIRKFPFITGAAVAFWGICIVVDPASGRFATIEHEAITCSIGLGFLLALVTTAGGISAMLTLASSIALLLRRIHAHPLGERVATFGSSLDFRLRLPFAALPDASGQIRCWFEKACAVSALLPKSDSWRIKIDGALERMLRSGRPNDVVASLDAAMDGERALPESQLALLRRRCGDQPVAADADLLAAVQQLAAVDILLFVFWALRRLRTFAATSISCSLLFALGIASYPFEPARELSTVAAVFVVTALLTSLVTFVVLERDPLLSELTGSSPGKIDWNWSFVQQVITWVILPFMAFLATKYPEQVRAVLDWATPYVHSK